MESIYKKLVDSLIETYDEPIITLECQVIDGEPYFNVLLNSRHVFYGRYDYHELYLKLDAVVAGYYAGKRATIENHYK